MIATTEPTVLTLDPRSGLLGWPSGWDERNYNGSNEPCDMIVGPCACGAWHGPDDWTDLLDRHNAEIRAAGESADAATLREHSSRTTLSYF